MRAHNSDVQGYYEVLLSSNIWTDHDHIPPTKRVSQQFVVDKLRTHQHVGLVHTTTNTNNNEITGSLA